MFTLVTKTLSVSLHTSCNNAIETWRCLLAFDEDLINVQSLMNSLRLFSFLSSLERFSVPRRVQYFFSYNCNEWLLITSDKSKDLVPLLISYKSFFNMPLGTVYQYISLSRQLFSSLMNWMYFLHLACP